MNRLFPVILGILFTAVPALAETPIDPAAAQFFESKVRPIFAEHCYKCHSAQAKKLKGELLLDSRAGVLRGGKSGPVIVAGKPETSRLIEAVRYGNPDLQMPPRDRLDPAIVADLEKWVAMGAPDPRTDAAPAVKPAMDVEAGKKFWSFQPLHHVEPPKPQQDANWARTPIDAFVLAMQQSKGLHPNGQASKEKLIRRAYFDLTGLPPTPQDVTEFVKDPAPDAYEHLLDRLLASPRYGERWGRHWLDVARYGESDGFEQDYDRPAAYQFRDFVIRAFNSDMPFDQFVQWQIAGDELAPDDWQAMAATGFLTAGVFPTQITEKEFESTRYNQLDDMISTMGNAMLGLTIGCARCHDHKYDPIATVDYYHLAATFATAIRSDVKVDVGSPAQRLKDQADWQAKIDALNAKIGTLEKDQADKKLAETISRVKENPAALNSEWSVLKFDAISAAHGAKYVALPDDSLLLQGPPPTNDTVTLQAKLPAMAINALRLETLADKHLPQSGPGAGANGNFALTEFDVQAGNGTSGGKVKIARAVATHEQNSGNLSIASAIDGDSSTGWAIDGQIGRNQAAIFYLDKPINAADGTLLTITLHFDHQSPQHLIGRMRLAVSSDASAKSFLGNGGMDPKISAILRKLAGGEEISAEDRQTARHWAAESLSGETAKLKAEVAKLKADGPPKQTTTVQATTEGMPPVFNHANDRGFPHFYKTVYLLRRGDPNNKVEPISYSFPRVLMRGGKDETAWQVEPPKGARTSYRRAGLAQWLTDTENGGGNLLARVIVNRLWQHHFGQGIVATPNDFGVQGERPTNPDLLDWLATDLVQHGWQLKRLQKLMMTSAAYLQDSQSSPERIAIDPHDAYVWRWQPRRLEAEPIRDSLLAVSGMLDETMFGPSTLDQRMRRRSIYFQIKRSQLIPMMMVLDWPESLNSVGSRPVTTVAPQALLFMNSSQARECAQAFAKRVHSELPADSITQAYRTAFGREPEKAELQLAEAFIQTQTESYRQANRPDAVGEAMADFCQAIMSANEFVYVD